MSNKIPVILGLDISTTCTAVCVLNADTKEHVKTYHASMINDKKFPDFWSKVKHMKTLFDSEHDPNWEVQAVGVEEIAKRFTPGFSSANTIITLAKFNSILSYFLLEKYGITPQNINVRSARKQLGITIDKTSKIDKKQQVLEQIVGRFPDLPWIYKMYKGKMKLVKYNQDRCDALIIALVTTGQQSNGGKIPTR